MVDTIREAKCLTCSCMKTKCLHLEKFSACQYGVESTELNDNAEQSSYVKKCYSKKKFLLCPVV